MRNESAVRYPCRRPARNRPAGRSRCSRRPSDGKQGQPLEHVADRRAGAGTATPASAANRRAVGVRDAARVGTLEPGKAPQEGGLAGAGGAKQDGDASLGYK